MLTKAMFENLESTSSTSNVTQFKTMQLCGLEKNIINYHLWKNNSSTLAQHNDGVSVAADWLSMHLHLKKPTTQRWKTGVVNREWQCLLAVLTENRKELLSDEVLLDWCLLLNFTVCLY